jgi:hypothetical protein
LDANRSGISRRMAYNMLDILLLLNTLQNLSDETRFASRHRSAAQRGVRQIVDSELVA